MPSAIRRASVHLEGLRAFGQRLLHRFLDARKVALFDQLGHQLGVEQHFHRRHAPARIGAQQALRDDGAQARARSDSSVGRASGE
jgi:hypothetical protein